MSYRFTNTDKWNDSWFINLSQIEMLLFLYLCDNCDIAGFIEINYKRWASDLGSSKETIEGALKGLQKGLKFSKNFDCIFVNNFLKHQKNYPLNEKNKAHLGILRRFELYSDKFEIQNINEFIEGASKGLQSPTGIGNGIGNGKDNIPEWKKNFDVYKEQLRIEFLELVKNEKYIKERESYHPNLDIKKTIEKACMDFWSKEKGWNHKKKSKTIDIDWKETFNNALSIKSNQVWKKKEIKEDRN